MSQVDDLSDATPAIVSRAGMVYFDADSCLVWKVSFTDTALSYMVSFAAICICIRMQCSLLLGRTSRTRLTFMCMSVIHLAILEIQGIQ